jgi:hypothetical protein
MLDAVIALGSWLPRDHEGKKHSRKTDVKTTTTTVAEITILELRNNTNIVKDQKCARSLLLNGSLANKHKR